MRPSRAVAATLPAVVDSALSPALMADTTPSTVSAEAPTVTTLPTTAGTGLASTSTLTVTVFESSAR